MHSIVIADTSCFILLTKINETNLLRELYSSVYTTPEIASEFKSVKPVLEKVRQTNFRISDEVLIEVLREAGES